MDKHVQNQTEFAGNQLNDVAINRAYFGQIGGLIADESEVIPQSATHVGNHCFVSTATNRIVASLESLIIV